MEGPLIFEAGQHLCQLLSIIRAHKKKVPTSAIQAFHRSSKSYLDILSRLGIAFKPKDHMLLEMSIRMAYMGSPQLYGNWHDEALNRLLRDVAGGAHSSVHERRILFELPRAHDNDRAGNSTAARKRQRSD